jgi:hypothetical protein
VADRPDWHAQVLIKGQYGATLVPVGVDDLGNLLAVIKGDFAGVLKTVAVDTDGLLLTNISRQGLDWLRVRPMYGQHKSLDSGTVSVNDQAWTTILSVSGQGTILSGWFMFFEGAQIAGQAIRIKIDGVTFISDDISSLFIRTMPFMIFDPVYALRWNETDLEATVGIAGPLNFETSFSIEGWQKTGGAVNSRALIYYALVPV